MAAKNYPLKHALTLLRGFLDRYNPQGDPFLLALSGGRDSLTLLHCLRMVAHPFAIAHVDHGWRRESGDEARQLQQMAQEWDIPFYQHTLNPGQITGNLESECRQERLKFFSTLCQRYGYCAVMTAHHADDKGETVLKRLFEGAHLANIKGMVAEVKLYDLTVWRPWLELPRSHIDAIIETLGLSPFDDHTNKDIRFMRGSMRTQIMPLLERFFGKQVCQPLCRIAKQSKDLNDFLELLDLQGYELKTGRNGTLLDMRQSEERTFHPFFLKYLIRKACQEQSIFLSYPLEETLCSLMIDGAANRECHIAHKPIHIDRHCLFIPAIQWKEEKEYKAVDSVHRWGSWLIQLKNGDEEQEKSIATGWFDAFTKGHLALPLPKDGCYEIGPAQLKKRYYRSSELRHWFTEQKVPAFLRMTVPLLYKDGQPYHEFLSGKVRCKLPDHPTKWLCLNIL